MELLEPVDMPVSQAGLERIDRKVRLLVATSSYSSMIHPCSMSSGVQLFGGAADTVGK